MNEITTIAPAGVQRRRAIAARPEVLARLEPLDKSVFLASTDKPFSEWDANALVVELDKLLNFIMRDIGCKQVQDSTRGYTAIRFAGLLKRYYGELTLQEFRLAFEFCVTGELDAYLPKRNGVPDREHYQQFNAEYMCKILNAYKERRRAVLCRANDCAPKPGCVGLPEDVCEWVAVTRRNCVDAFLHYKYRGRMPRLSQIDEKLIYETLVRAGLADEIAPGVNEQKIIFERLTRRLAGQRHDLRQLRAEGLDAEALQYDAFVLARRRALERAFADMVRTEVQIRDYIKI